MVRCEKSKSIWNLEVMVWDEVPTRHRKLKPKSQHTVTWRPAAFFSFCSVSSYKKFGFIMFASWSESTRVKTDKFRGLLEAGVIVIRGTWQANSDSLTTGTIILGQRNKRLALWLIVEIFSVTPIGESAT
jgi:hypothetical protein